jgi:hypothetical protein
LIAGRDGFARRLSIAWLGECRLEKAESVVLDPVVMSQQFSQQHQHVRFAAGQRAEPVLALFRIEVQRLVE